MAHILFIEDESITMKYLSMPLSMAGYDVTHAKDGEEALRYLKDKNYHFDLLIMDIMFPRGDASDAPSITEDIDAGEMGIEILRQLRKKMDIQTPVIVLSSVEDDEFKSKIIKEFGVNRYFVKPAPVNTFMDAVNNALSKKGKQ